MPLLVCVASFPLEVIPSLIEMTLAFQFEYSRFVSFHFSHASSLLRVIMLAFPHLIPFLNVTVLSALWALDRFSAIYLWKLLTFLSISCIMVVSSLSTKYYASLSPTSFCQTSLSYLHFFVFPHPLTYQLPSSPNFNPLLLTPRPTPLNLLPHQ